ncbi:MAG: hypothetical protein WCF26_09725 [Candidatus Sulfotelmatobacter sp.]
MDRVTEERQYVLQILYRMRDEVVSNPDLFDLDAQERIEQSIAFLQEKAIAA